MVFIRDIQYELFTAGFLAFLCYTSEKNETLIALRQAGRKGFANLEVWITLYLQNRLVSVKEALYLEAGAHL